VELHLVAEKVDTTFHKNTTASYGLTLVAGLPLPRAISKQVKQVQAHLETLAPHRFSWYGLDQLHATVLAPLRGRYRAAPALCREELPVDLTGFLHDLSDCFIQQSPFSLQLAGVRIAEDGMVLVHERTLMQRLMARLSRHPELDRPKHDGGLHISIGYLQTSNPFASNTERLLFQAELSRFAEIPIGDLTIRQVWLVHYGNRTLSRIVGKVLLKLGQPNQLSVPRVLAELGITNIQYPES
jgi:2'-5' RNA ligase superfamily